MTTYTARRPDDTGEFPIGHGTRDLRNYLAAPHPSPLPRHDITATIYFTQAMPPRQSIFLADVPTVRFAIPQPSPAEVQSLKPADVVPGLTADRTVRPARYVGVRRHPIDAAVVAEQNRTWRRLVPALAFVVALFVAMAVAG